MPDFFLEGFIEDVVVHHLYSPLTRHEVVIDFIGHTGTGFQDAKLRLSFSGDALQKLKGALGGNQS